MVTKYITTNPYTPADISKALSIAEKVNKESNGEIDVCIYVIDKARYSTIEGVDLLKLNAKNNSFEYGVVSPLHGNIYTFRSLPDFTKTTIVIAVCITDHELARLDNDDNILGVIAVPDMLDDCKHWLYLHNSVNIADGQLLGGAPVVSAIVKRAIGWLIAKKRPTHPLDNMHIESYIKDVANVVNHLDGVSDNDNIIRHCIERGLTMKEAIAVARIISGVPRKGYAMSPTANFDYLVDWVNDAKYEAVVVQ